VLNLLAEGETTVDLPMSSAAFGLTAIALFAVLLAVTFAFRGVAHRHEPLDHHHHEGH